MVITLAVIMAAGKIYLLPWQDFWPIVMAIQGGNMSNKKIIDVNIEGESTHVRIIDALRASYTNWRAFVAAFNKASGAGCLDITENACSTWRAKGRIPRSYWHVIEKIGKSVTVNGKKLTPSVIANAKQGR